MRRERSPEQEVSAGPEPGTLYLVGTPLGNLEDITLRAQRILQEVDLVAAEDTRRTRRLLTHLGVKAPIVSYYRHNEKQRSAELVERIRQGVDVALVSDAGMPLISDPGSLLVSAALEAGVVVIAVPGPTAVTTALVVSGLDSQRYAFEGFIPRTSRERETRLAELAQEPRTMVIYEAPHRLLRTLTDLQRSLGNRAAAVARELTKLHEECVRGDISDLLRYFQAQPPRGECVVVVAGAKGLAPEPATLDRGAIARLLCESMESGQSRRDAVRIVSAETGLPRREVYQVSLTLPGERRS